jgi:hypothetical protein
MGKTKVVLDTNVWTSFCLKKKLANEFVKEGVRIYVSNPILAELARALSYPKLAELLDGAGLSPKEIIRAVVDRSETVRPRHKLRIVKDDPADDRILECALQANCKFIISGDRHLLKLGKFRNIEILSLREFLKRFG